MPIKIAIIGCGAIAEDLHLPAMKATPGVELAAVVDADLARAKICQQKHGALQSASRLAEVAGSLDAVILCTPPHLHAVLALEAFENGLHVLCEKPLANSYAECQRMVAAARTAGKVLACAHIFRFNPVREEIRKIITAGTHGKVKEASVAQGNPYSWKTVTGYNMRRELMPGGVLIDAGIHPLDTLFSWLGEPEGFAYEDDSLGGLESNVRLKMQFAGNVSASLRLSRTAPLDNKFRLRFEAAEIVLSAFSRWEYELRAGRGWEKQEVFGRQDDLLHGQKLQLADFVESITAGRPPRVPGEDGASMIRLVEGCYAAKRARPLPRIAPSPGITW